MISFEKALGIMKAVDTRVDTEIVPLIRCAGRVVPDSVKARIELPPFSKSAMDGYAISSTDKSESYTIIETIAAGEVPKEQIRTGTCAKIMTGAMMPDGADSVIRVEYTKESGGSMTVVTPESGDNVIKRGENVSPGEAIFSPGIVKPRHIGIFAEHGIAELRVCKSPVVGVIATGSELRDPGDPLETGNIYNSNGSQLCSQIEEMGCISRYYGIVEDDRDAVVTSLQVAVSECDVVVLSGGVSMGDYDYVPDSVSEVGGHILFHKVAVKPGKPLLFARREDTYVVGLPGNPVSTYIIFEVLVKPMLYSLMGIDTEPVAVAGVLSDEVRRRDAARLEFRPVHLAGKTVSSVRYHGSSHLHALGAANALLTIDKGVERIPKGTEVYVRPL